MQGNFTRGLLIGGLIGASVGTMMNPDMMRNRSRRKAMRAGRNLLWKSGHIIGDVMDLLR